MSRHENFIDYQLSPAALRRARLVPLCGLSILEMDPRENLSSYGFLRAEPYEPNDPDQEKGHKEAEIKVDLFDEHEFVTVIDYFMHKVIYSRQPSLGIKRTILDSTTSSKRPGSTTPWSALMPSDWRKKSSAAKKSCT